MKINFDDTSYIEMSFSQNGKIMIVLSARDGKNPKNNIVNSAEISQEQFLLISKELMSKFQNFVE